MPAQKNKPPPGFFLTDEKRTPDVFRAIENLPHGVGVIFRHYRSPDRAKLAEKAVQLCRGQNRIFLIGADPKLAYKIGADGLHVPKWAWRQGLFPGYLDPRWLITVSAHSAAGITRAKGSGADAILLAPVFATESHPETMPLGIHCFSRLCRLTDLPVYVLGGVTKENIKQIPPIENLAGPAGITLYL